MTDYLDQYHELTYYTLSLHDPGFIHQHVVDAFGAQMAGEQTKPIALFFSLAGLYLLIEKGYSGRQIQQAHQIMASRTKNFITLTLPKNRGSISIQDVLNQPPGDERNDMIIQWCQSVWLTYSDQHKKIIAETEKRLAKADT